MTLPLLLLVDDSDAILAYERAALMGQYETASARNGEEALHLLRDLRPAAILLDLSMPKMDGEEVLAVLRASDHLAEIPVVIVSSERERGEACLSRGAQAYVPKPIQAEDLRSAVARVIEQAERTARRGSVAILAVEVGGIALAVPLAAVEGVFHLPETQPLLGGPPFLAETLELRGRPVPVLDLGRRLGVVHATSVVDRKVVAMAVDGATLAITVDQVFDPEEIAPADLLPQRALGIGDHPPAAQLLEAVVRTARGPLPLIRPAALLSARLLARMALLLRRAVGAEAAT
jgi:CheY-like chemotaxis protein/chemotaxis signal transduction protein